MGILNFGVVVNAILFVFGLIWCREIIKRLGKDIDGLKNSQDKTEKVVIVFYWIVTAFIIFLMANFAVGIIGAIV